MIAEIGRWEKSDRDFLAGFVRFLFHDQPARVKLR